ncbi:MAG TPA: hypothetical protein VF650_11225 [Allosphingosinicella sp.]|jgi:hypothetical protein
MNAFDEMKKTEALAKAERRMAEALGTSRSADLAGMTGLSKQLEARSRAIDEAMGFGNLGGPRRRRAGSELGSTVADRLGKNFGDSIRACRAADVFGSTISDALGMNSFGASGGRRAANELSCVADALGARIGGRSLSGDVFGSTIAEALGSGVGGHAKAHERLREAFATNPLHETVGKGGGRGDLEKQIAEVHSSTARPERMLEPIRLPQPLPNPAHETNRHLRQVGEKIDALLEVQAQQAELIDALLKAQIAAGHDQNRIWRRDHRFTVIGLALSLLAVLVSVIF